MPAPSRSVAALVLGASAVFGAAASCSTFGADVSPAADAALDVGPGDGPAGADADAPCPGFCDGFEGRSDVKGAWEKIDVDTGNTLTLGSGGASGAQSLHASVAKRSSASVALIEKSLATTTAFTLQVAIRPDDDSSVARIVNVVTTDGTSRQVGLKISGLLLELVIQMGSAARPVSTGKLLVVGQWELVRLDVNITARSVKLTRSSVAGDLAETLSPQWDGYASEPLGLRVGGVYVNEDQHLELSFDDVRLAE